MAVFHVALLLFLWNAVTFAVTVSPEYLDMLLLTKNYEKYAEIMGIDDVDLVKPGPGTSRNPMFNKGLKEGDILVRKKEEGRQHIDFDKYPGNKWPKGEVPYTISMAFGFDRSKVQQGVDNWNSRVNCIKFVPRNGQKDYVQMFPGNGCYSYLGKTGGAQPLSLGMGCVYTGIINHEMEHAIGFTHEHNRGDRDENVKVLWENIPPQWQSQYEKNDDEKYGVYAAYDYYSLMHYPLKAPDSNKPAFEILKPGIDGSKLGQRDGFRSTDLEKIHRQYCN